MIDVVIFASPGRDEAHRRMFGSVEASDIGKRYTVSMHPEGKTAFEHWRDTHLLASRSKEEFVLVLEDDVLVNRFIVSNLETWHWKWHKDFGGGWAYNPGAYSQKDVWYRGAKPWAMTPGVLYRTRDLPGLIDIAWRKMTEGLVWDCSMAWACESNGKRIRVHYPSLVEHLNDLPSKLGNPNKTAIRTSRGTFDVGWRRPKDDPHAHVDQYGRVRSVTSR